MYKKDYLNKRTFAKEFKMLDKNHENFIILTADHVEDSPAGIAVNLNQKCKKTSLWIPMLLGVYIKFLADNANVPPSKVIKEIMEMSNINAAAKMEPLIYDEKDKAEIIDYLSLLDKVVGSDE